MMNAKDKCKVLLVDDEPIILRSLQMALPWAELGTQLVGTARNGEEALEIVEMEQPEIIISDIRMPSIDGITLMRTVMEQYPGTLFIILSGYGEFEYAQEAIRYGAFNYLLKPIDHDELQETVAKARDRILQQRAASLEQDRLRRSVQSLASLVRERMFTGIIDGTDDPDHKPAYWPDEWELQSPYYMGLVNLDDQEQAEDIWSAKEKRLWHFAVGNILSELLHQRGCFTVFPYHQGEWLFIMQNSDIEEMQGLAQEIIDAVKQYTKLSVSVGISKQFMHINTLQDSYESCRNALCRRFTMGREVVCVDEETVGDSQTTRRLAYPMQREKALVDALRTLDRAAFDAELTALMQELKREQPTKTEVSPLLVQLVIVLHRQLESFHVLGDAQPEPLLHQLSLLNTLEEMIEAIGSRFHEWMKTAASADDQVSGRTFVQRAIEYVHHHYDRDLSIDEVAEAAGLSCSYFCVLFKQQTGSTFLDYLTRYRIDKACSILRNSDVKVFQIAPLVGYQDPKYFTQVFKKIVGMTPSEYRTSQLST
jgi:two-component system response regulator YesN